MALSQVTVAIRPKYLDKINFIVNNKNERIFAVLDIEFYLKFIENSSNFTLVEMEVNE